jgi:regulator of sirC expression with transglutaminase-like and TPR domain
MASISPAPGRRAFALLLQRPDAEIDWVEAALLIARGADPGLDPVRCRGQIEALAAQVRQRLDERGIAHAADPHFIRPTLETLNRVLFEEAGFCGNTDAYYDPRNSYLNEVLAGRRGIPITLALVYIEVARRAGLRLHGVGLPGHFLVGWAPPGADLATSDEALFIDAFHGGLIRTPAECAVFFHRLHGSDCAFARRFLAPVTARQYLARLLGNLKSIYLGQNDLVQTLRIVDYLLQVQPHASGELRLRGMLYYRLGAFVPALSDLRHYLQAQPDAPDAPQVRYHIELLHNLLVAAN